MHVHMHWISYCLATTKLSSWGWGRLCLQSLHCICYLVRNKSLEIYNRQGGGTLFKAFQNTQLKQTLEAKGPGPFPYLACQPLCFRTGPCICASLWGGSFGLAHGLPQGLPLAHYMLEQSLPLAYPWPTPGLPLAYQV